MPPRLATALLAPLLLMPLSGCVAMGLIASKLPERPVEAAYKGMAGQSVAVMVWCDRQTSMDFNAIQLDLANTIQNRLKLEQDKNKRDELKATTFPVLPASIIRYQRDHPETEALPITKVAPDFNVTRLIYIELEDFQTRPDGSLELFRGSMIGTIRILEINGDTAKIAFEENSLRSVFPKKSPPEGVPNAGDRRIYAGTIDAFAGEVVNRLITHTPEDE